MAIYDFFEQDSYKNLANEFTATLEGGSGGDAGKSIMDSIMGQFKPQDLSSTGSDGLTTTFSKAGVGDAGAESGGSGGSGWGGRAAAIGGAVGRLLPNAQASEGELESTTNAVNTINTVKDTIGNVIPIAGLFRGVEKLGVIGGKAIGGDRGKAISEGYLSPIQTVGKLQEEGELSGSQRMLGTLATIALPFGGTIAGNMIHKANQKRVAREREIAKFKKQTKREQEYYDREQEQSLIAAQNAQNAQMNYINPKF